MKKKSLIITISVIVLLVIVCTITIYANLSDPQEIPLDKLHTIRSDAEQIKTLELYNHKSGSSLSLNKTNTDNSYLADNGTVLKYKETENISTEVIQDTYTDPNGNEYKYDQKGRLSDFILKSQTRDEQSELQINTQPITEQQAQVFAQKYAYTIFGNRFDGFELEKYYYNADAPEHQLTFVKKIKFAVTSYCVIELFPNGDIKSVIMAHEDYHTDFNKELLNNVSEKDIYKFISEQVSNDFEIEAIAIVKENNEFALNIAVKIYNEETGIFALYDYIYKLK